MLHKDEGIRVPGRRVAAVRKAGVLIAALATFAVSPASAGAPVCYPYGSSGYCQYNGRVAQAYINAYSEILMYFDTPANPADISAVGLTGVSNYQAARYHTVANPEFGKALYASLLSAQARGATVTVQMHSTGGGYLQIDRIWVNE
jgi:hypothetical protein